MYTYTASRARSTACFMVLHPMAAIHKEISPTLHSFHKRSSLRMTSAHTRGRCQLLALPSLPARPQYRNLHRPAGSGTHSQHRFPPRALSHGSSPWLLPSWFWLPRACDCHPCMLNGYEIPCPQPRLQPPAAAATILTACLAARLAAQHGTLARNLLGAEFVAREGVGVLVSHDLVAGGTADARGNHTPRQEDLPESLEAVRVRLQLG